MWRRTHRGSRALANASWTFTAELARITSAILTLTLVGRTLGAADYGQFAAIYAAALVILPFANMGVPLLIVQRINRDAVSIDTAAGVGLSMTLLGSIIGITALVALVPLLMGPVPMAAVLLLGVSELLFVGLSEYAAALAAGDRRFRLHALIITVWSICRSVAAVVLYFMTDQTLTQWAFLLLLFTCIGSVTAVSIVWRAHGIRPHLILPNLRDVKEGMPYSVGLASFWAQDAIDKPLLVRYGWSTDAGLYSAAARVSNFAMVPVRAVLYSTFAEFFSVGKEGVHHLRSFAKRFLAPATAYALGAGVLMLLLAPAVEIILGPTFDGAAVIVRALAAFPLIRTLQFFAANILTGAGHHGVRVWIVLSTLIPNTLLCLVLIPEHSWRGALVATYVSEIALSAALWIGVVVLARN
jgi:O-antigen/teichoic acid export membrane protein